VIFLDDHKCFQGSAEVAVGGQAALSFSLRELFQRALTAQARGMILAHNHPSGDCRPSLRDIEGTQKISTVAKPLGIEIVDHLIFSEVSVYSMRKGEEL
jgi:DNA repair protein RadC